ncbi:O-methyltransferase [Ralstonia pseudosolanacearum]|uniref:O-methyltransferase n=1 Tax=Ralstonia pseudosolanacearum TaxID=1310165 RepID=UPI0026771A85|nr:O-methyltransferase [Ralstonia pseudosolanacearum]MDO3507189.1 hypothetical protein [Ralstonia pseudosolanacearum]MDO3514037.1 hypothetical protein [Ralstonia pseudosolanacearum]MDO3538590.1 hypothetical protein [Ralstonia pseudosolanacearum]MDO3606887.1 hypothetical protein [Ralstonia pseudosolanacearum]MDO3611388.1 hypothetical protein [Ralstonia pseudosolanacearum]
MTSSPSFERIDYQLRYNKHIERKMIFDLLSRAHQHVGLANHRYLGLGSIWFADFRLAHRMLGMHNMVSMEREPYADRARFNSPYHSIDVKGGDSSTTLDELDWTTPTVSWLDYDGALTPSVSSDIRKVLEKSPVDSILIVTVNAARGTYRPRQVPAQRKRSETALGQIESMLMQGVVSQRFEPTESGASHGDVREADFPEFLAEAILAFMMHVAGNAGHTIVDESGNAVPVVFLPLFNFCHKDNADMVTVGGALIPLGSSVWSEGVAADVLVDSVNALPRHLRLDLVPLTLKEKLVLDSCLPATETGNFVERAKACGIRIDDDELVKYWQHYRHFPVFFEAPI